MNPFLLPPAERLADWRQFRNTLPNLTEEQQLTAVANYWAKAPLLTTAYDLENCKDWPTIWEMIHANQWCRSSVAIGMEATLRLAGMQTERLTLALVNDRTIQAILMLLIVDDQWLLNYDWGSFRRYPDTDFHVMWKWRYIGRGYSILDG